MPASDRPPKRPRSLPPNRYAWVRDCTERLLIYDLENSDAWVRGDVRVSLHEWR